MQWLHTSPTLPAEQGAALLRGLLSALGQPRRPEDAKLFVKTDGWHVCHIDRILSAFPGVPWLFLYRDPVEVLVSQARMPSTYMISGALIQHGLHPPGHLLAQPLEHAAWMLGRIMADAALAMSRHPGGLLANYRELPEILETRLAGHFGLVLDGAEIAALRSAGARDAKNPHQAFQADSAEKRASANAGIREVAERWLAEPYAELERLRALA